MAGGSKLSQLDDERRHLDAAIRHLAEGAERIAHQKAVLMKLPAGTVEQQQAKNLLTTFEGTLEQWQLHRKAIIARIGILEAAQAL
jgi:7,8-dihydro-6-hydroxymethylpterin-pyrophosphokinase